MHITTTNVNNIVAMKSRKKIWLGKTLNNEQSEKRNEERTNKGLCIWLENDRPLTDTHTTDRPFTLGETE